MDKAIFWDFDGTITYSEHIWSNSVYKWVPDSIRQRITFENVRAHMAYGFPWDEENLNRVLKGVDFWAFLLRKFRLLYQSYGAEEEEAAIAAQKVRSSILNVENYRIYPDAEETLALCRQKEYKNYILSNNYPELEAMIEKLGLTGYFDGFIVSGVIGYNKPCPEIFAYALALAGNPDIRYMIGDNPRADILGGNAAGMKTILVHNKAGSDAAFTFEMLNGIINVLH